MNAKFMNINATADFIGPGAIEVPIYQTEILDLVRRRGILGQRIKQVPATGHPSRYFEETAIPAAAASSAFVNPRAIVPSIVQPTRVENAVPLKALVSQIDYNLFDIELGKQQSQFAYLQAKDLTDTVDGILRTHDIALWNGTDTSFSSPTTPQYFGAIGQIVAGGNTTTISTTELIVDGLKSTIAQMLSNSNFAVRPTAIYANPVLLDLIDREMKSEFNVVLNTKNIEGGLTVKTLSTQAGDIPLIPGVDAAFHRRPGLWLCCPAGLHRYRGPDRVPLAGRAESARLPARPAEFAGEPVRGGQVRRCGGQGRELCPLPGTGRSLERMGAGAWGALRLLPDNCASEEGEDRWDICCQQIMWRMDCRRIQPMRG
jgi:hypothetical protein